MKKVVIIKKVDDENLVKMKGAGNARYERIYGGGGTAKIPV